MVVAGEHNVDAGVLHCLGNCQTGLVGHGALGAVDRLMQDDRLPCAVGFCGVGLHLLNSGGDAAAVINNSDVYVAVLKGIVASLSRLGEVKYRFCGFSLDVAVILVVAQNMDHIDARESRAVHLGEIRAPVSGIILDIVDSVAGLDAEGIYKLAAGDVLDGRIEVCGITALDIGKHKEIGRSLAVAGGGGEAESFGPLTAVADLIVIGGRGGQILEQHLVDAQGNTAVGLRKGDKLIAALHLGRTGHVFIGRQTDYGIRLGLVAYCREPCDALAGIGILNGVVLDAVGRSVIFGRDDVDDKGVIP